MIFKTYFKKTAIAFTSILALSSLCPQAIHATLAQTTGETDWREHHRAWQRQQQALCNGYLDLVDTQFKDATTDQGREALVTDAFNLAYLCGLKTLDELHEGLLRAHIGLDPHFYEEIDGTKRFNCDKSTPIALAIGMMRVDLVRRWLPTIGDVNARALSAWGYRQPYTLGHHAIDPSYPNIGVPFDAEAALEIMDLLHKRGIDWHADFKSPCLGVYSGPPLGAGNSRDRKLDPLTIRGLLYGIKPDAVGTSCHNSEKRLERDERFIDALYADAKKALKEEKRICPAPPVAGVLEAKRIEELAFLSSFSFMS